MRRVSVSALRRSVQAGVVSISLFAVAVANPASAASPSGQAVAVIQATSASGPGGDRTLAKAGPVFSGDRINTGKTGEAQIQFIDDTRLVVGANSSIVIDKYVFNPNKTVAQVGIQFTRGAFRFITGSGPKRAYSIVTPTATLGIRGTMFDIAVGERIGTGVVVFDGEVQMCSRRSGECTIIRSGCGAAVALPNGALGSPQSTGDKAALIRTQFPLISRQRQLRNDFRVNTNGCGRLTAPPNPSAVRQINFNPAGPVADPPDSPSGINPGTSGRTSGATRSISSNASSTATSSPGKSSSSNAGGKGKSSGKSNNSGKKK